jgi:hypothetical protein
MTCGRGARCFCIELAGLPTIRKKHCEFEYVIVCSRIEGNRFSRSCSQVLGVEQSSSLVILRKVPSILALHSMPKVSARCSTLPHFLFGCPTPDDAS